MNQRKMTIAATLLIVLLSLLAAVSCGKGQATPTSAPGQATSPALDGQALVQERCAQCHGVGRVTQAKKTEAEWKTAVERMVSKGANLSAAEQNAVIQYLAKQYPK